MENDGIRGIIALMSGLLYLFGSLIYFNKHKLSLIKHVYITKLAKHAIGLLTIVFTLIFGLTISSFVPELFLHGWTYYLFGESHNIFVAPLTISTSAQLSNYWYIFLIFYLVFILAIPFIAFVEESIFRKGHFYWKNIIKQSILFGLCHFFVGLSFIWCLILIIPGLVFGWGYRKAYLRSITSGESEIVASNAGLLYSTTIHSLYNFYALSFISFPLCQDSCPI